MMNVIIFYTILFTVIALTAIFTALIPISIIISSYLIHANFDFLFQSSRQINLNIKYEMSRIVLKSR